MRLAVYALTEKIVQNDASRCREAVLVREKWYGAYKYNESRGLYDRNQSKKTQNKWKKIIKLCKPENFENKYSQKEMLDCYDHRSFD